jgi:hypothetical protein
MKTATGGHFKSSHLGGYDYSDKHSSLPRYWIIHDNVEDVTGTNIFSFFADECNQAQVYAHLLVFSG